MQANRPRLARIIQYNFSAGSHPGIKITTPMTAPPTENKLNSVLNLKSRPPPIRIGSDPDPKQPDTAENWGGTPISVERLGSISTWRERDQFRPQRNE